MPSRDELHARLFLLNAAEPPSPVLHGFVTLHGPVDAAAFARRGAAPAEVLSEIARPDARIDADLQALDTGTARLVTPEDEEWPFDRLSGLASLGVPLALWVHGSGSLTELARTAVTVTGARASTAYGNTVAADLGYDLARAGATVVSGGGLGVDHQAHRGALAADGPTIVVLPTGIDVTYPAQHSRLFQTVIDQGGLLVSEYPIGTRPARARVRARSRLLAALSSATVIVEAGRRSAALATARTAGELGRRVYGVPGPIHSAASKGVHELLRTGVATVACSADEIEHGEDRDD